MVVSIIECWLVGVVVVSIIECLLNAFVVVSIKEVLISWGCGGQYYRRVNYLGL